MKKLFSGKCPVILVLFITLLLSIVSSTAQTVSATALKTNIASKISSRNSSTIAKTQNESLKAQAPLSKDHLQSQVKNTDSNSNTKAPAKQKSSLPYRTTTQNHDVKKSPEKIRERSNDPNKSRRLPKLYDDSKTNSHSKGN